MSGKNWYDGLPRPELDAWERVHVKEDWYWVYRMPCDMYAIVEPGQWQETISYLVLGDKQAALVDTGMGFGDLKSVVEELTTLPVFVINSHFHKDHTGCNYQFEKCYNIQDEFSLSAAKNGVPHEALLDQVEGDAIWLPAPKGFDKDKYVNHPWNSLPMKQGDVFDLGNRKLLVLAAPGHTEDTAFIYDEKFGCLFTGDNVYPATIYLHMDGTIYRGRSSLDLLVRSLEAHAEYARKSKYICGAHNLPGCENTLYFDLLESAKRIQRGEVTPVDRGDGTREYAGAYPFVIR